MALALWCKAGFWVSLISLIFDLLLLWNLCNGKFGFIDGVGIFCQLWARLVLFLEGVFMYGEAFWACKNAGLVKGMRRLQFWFQIYLVVRFFDSLWTKQFVYAMRPKISLPGG